MKKKKSTKSVASQSTNFFKLSKGKQEILSMLNDEGLNRKQICNRKKCSHQYVNRIKKELKREGLYIQNKIVAKKDPTLQPYNRKIRLHGIHAVIDIIDSSEKYKREHQKRDVSEYKGNKVVCTKNVVQIHFNEDFYGDTTNEVQRKCLEYLFKLASIIENDLGIILIKDRKHNIRIAVEHYAETNNELAKEYNQNGKVFLIRSTENGIVWARIDNSLNLNEFETVDPQTAKEDMDTILQYFNDWRNNHPPTNTELKNLLYQNALQLNKFITLFNNGLESNKSHPVGQNTSKNIKVPDYIG